MFRKEVAPGIIQITLDEDRWYRIEMSDKKDDFIYLPSVTWILESYPKGIGFQKYLASLGSWEEGRKILKDAGERGGKVHAGIETLLMNKPLSIDNIMPEHFEPFTGEEWKYIMTFVEWYKRYQPIVISVEEVVYMLDNGYGYAGTIDLICEIDKGMFEKVPKKTGETETWIIDWKTSSNIYESYKCQISAYQRALSGDNPDWYNIGIVRLGSRHKCGYEFWQLKDYIEIQHYFDLFLNVKKIWEHENPNPEPKTIDVPETINLLEVLNEENDQTQDNERSEGKNKDGVKNGEGVSEELRLFQD